MNIPIYKQTATFVPTSTRVITRFFHMGDESRQKGIIERILKLSESEVEAKLEEVFTEFAHRHKGFEDSLMHNYSKIEQLISNTKYISGNRKLLIGSYFTMEFSIESAALFNPSIVVHPDQDNLKPGELNIIVSLRATGEGHISSIEFRSGTINQEGEVVMHGVSRFVAAAKRIRISYDKESFISKLKELSVYDILQDIFHDQLAPLPNTFTLQELFAYIDDVTKQELTTIQAKSIETLLWFARSNYEISFDPDYSLSERVIFPVTANETKGIEDARFVRFVDEKGEVTYYAPYTAYNGFTILPQMIETKDFCTFRINTLNGPASQNKGMALFPRKVNGKYAMISRQDNENLFILFSDNIYYWDNPVMIKSPTKVWELIQIGNCGSPIETEEGWLLLTHGVGPMRKYCIGVELLDLHNPSKIIAQLKTPLLSPNEQEREGYVPNVLYSCGALIHNDNLIVPYGISDISSKIATTPVKPLLESLLQNKIS
ncbi:MAG: glycosidase [Candidatus Margulisiibacteriota bacterium]|nr:MAG: hypothetical protein A2X41_10375 [Candidatus Margulisbacteria bacterium GWE2_39_32]PZM78968.1 MAG: glycosidase [Candidatus Margulisiibacteriota bacterium]HCY36935.1 glycosidase [Candidatus Margulisiibacteriota bacterium]